MSVKLAKSAGFCFGVDRAVELVEKAAGEGKKVLTLGPIIHNRHVVDGGLRRRVRDDADLRRYPGTVHETVFPGKGIPGLCLRLPGRGDHRNSDALAGLGAPCPLWGRMCCFPEKK